MTSLADLSPTRAVGTTDLTVSPLCLGGNVFGWTCDAPTSADVLDAYAAAGGNFVDTADSYSYWVPGHVGGESESIIGDWMAARGNRDEMVIATKVGKHPEAGGTSAANVAASVDGSLRRLRTDRIDLYYAHLDDDSVALEETLGALDAAVRAGKVRYVAASNFSAARLQEALGISGRDGLARFEAIQNQYHLMHRTDYEGEVAEVVAAHGLASFPFYALARGFLTGKYRAGGTIDSPRAVAVEQYAGERGDRVLDALEALAQAHHCTMAEVALAWLLHQPTVTAPIASARSVEQWDGIAGCASVSLGTEDLAVLDEASA
ncbi:MAG: aldo/keto reductase [Actinobacteria bacterium]|nr:aldo/keto reductase [Actinomycetota bacterium]